jgi:hypothetical protein
MSRTGEKGARRGIVSPIASWFAGTAAARRFRARHLGREPAILPPLDEAWRSITPGFEGSLALAASGYPFQVVANRRYDRSGDPRRLRRDLAAGKTIYLPQVHQVLPRLMRLMVALRAVFLGPFREECSFLFVVNGSGRPGMGLHHDGEVDAFWLQLAGRRTVTVGPAVPKGTPEDLDDRLMERGRRGDWWTRPLEPGSLLYLPPRTPHCVVCHEPSLALSLTWKQLDPRAALAAALDGLDPSSLPQPRGSALGAFCRMVARTLGRAGSRAWARAAAKAYAIGLTAWDIAPGRPVGGRHENRHYLWTQVPAVALPAEGRHGQFRLWTPHGTLRLPAAARPLAVQLATMPTFPRDAAGEAKTALAALLNGGIVAPHDLPLRIAPKDPASLDGWNFA